MELKTFITILPVAILNPDNANDAAFDKPVTKKMKANSLDNKRGKC